MFIKLTNIIAYICDGEAVCLDCYVEPEGEDVEESPIFEADRDNIGHLYCPYCESDI